MTADPEATLRALEEHYRTLDALVTSVEKRLAAAERVIEAASRVKPLYRIHSRADWCARRELAEALAALAALDVEEKP